MTVPEAAMHETDSSEPPEDQVWRSRELPIMQTVPEPARMQCATKDQFRFRVLAPDSRHHSRPDLSINYVGHELACIARKERDRACISQCQRRSKSTPLAGVKMHHLMRFSPALAVVPVVHRRDPRCFV